MKKVLLIITTILLLNFASALNITIEKLSSDETMVAELGKPADFQLALTNNGPSTNIELYNLVGFSIYPSGKIPIGNQETKTINVQVYPIGNFNYIGYYKFKYYIKGDDGSQIEDTLIFKRVKLQDCFSLGAGDFDPESSSVEVFVKNKENFDFGNVNAKLSSPFFNVERAFTLAPYERKNITISLDKEQFKELVAGFYTLDTEIQAQNKKVNYKETLRFVEKEIIKTTETSSGIIVNTQTIKKINEGNVIAKAEINQKKTILSRLFTTFSPEPDTVERKGFLVYYSWNRDIKPGETLEISIRTNWTMPLIIAVLIVIIVVLVKLYTRTNLSLSKRVSFVRAKGGEFALKVFITARAQRYIEKISIIDRLPPLVKVYEKFGVEQPSKIDEKNRRLVWEFDSMQPGEIKTISYIIYSKVGVLGKFALPAAAGVFEREGVLHETQSNKAFFVAEQGVVRED
jgi:hypothetical protein